MMKYEAPEMEIVSFACEDIIAPSSSIEIEDGNLRPNELPIG